MNYVQPGEHTKCLDLFQVAFSPETGNSFRDCAILLEVWSLGGLLQTSIRIPEGATISIPFIGNGILAKAVSCQQDDFGFIVEISVSDPQWFPDGYTPPHVLH